MHNILIAKLKTHQYILMVDWVNFILAKVFCYTVVAILKMLHFVLCIHVYNIHTKGFI